MGELTKPHQRTETDDTVNPSRHCSDLDISSQVSAFISDEVVKLYVPLEKLNICRMNRMASTSEVYTVHSCYPF